TAPDRINETVTLRNGGATAIDLDGWFLRDAGGRVWTLASLGNLAPGQSATIQRNGMPMSLNNTGDTIVLLDAANQEQDRFEYSATQPGALIETGH
ncbi:MAG: lamin tail domain-containing protein, partial [Nitrospirota bacterium]